MKYRYRRPKDTWYRRLWLRLPPAKAYRRWKWNRAYKRIIAEAGERLRMEIDREIIKQLTRHEDTP